MCTTAIQSLEDMFVYQLEEMYYVEHRLVDVLDELATEANNDTLAKGFQDHRDETREHVARIERVFESIGRRPSDGRARSSRR